MAFDTLTEEARDRLDDAVELRRTLHRHPELGLELPFTQERVLEALDGLPLTVTLGESTTSVTALLEGEQPGPTILLRGDMDALPLSEDAAVEFVSSIDGNMHACGHDLHTAMLAGSAHVLADHRRDLKGRVLFMFQPGEEGFGGARVMLEEGLLDRSTSAIDAAFAIHVTTWLPNGIVALRSGPLMASADVLRIRVTGKGGHASAPHLALDPIPIACEIVQAIQTMVTRKVDPFDPAVVTVAQITAGTTNNVIPETATIVGTIRAVSERTRDLVHANLQRLAEGIASAHGLEATVAIEPGYPVTINDHGAASFVSTVASELLGERSVVTMPAPVMGAEDWSYVLQRVPGAMAFLGACPPALDPRTAPSNHSNRVVFDESAMTSGIALYSAVALRHLGAA